MRFLWTAHRPGMIGVKRGFVFAKCFASRLASSRFSAGPRGPLAIPRKTIHQAHVGLLSACGTLANNATRTWLQRAPRCRPRGLTSRGISPITMGLLALLAYKTVHDERPLGGLFRQGRALAGNAPPVPTQASAGGYFLDWLQNGLGGALAGGAAGTPDLLIAFPYK